MHSDFCVTLVSVTLKCPHVKCVCVVHAVDVNLLLTDIFSGMWSAAVCPNRCTMLPRCSEVWSQTVLARILPCH